MTIINDIKFNWTEYKTQSTRLFYKGCEETAYGLLNILNNDNSLDQLDYFLKKNKDFSSGIVEDEDVLIAWVDHIRSWPIFYYQSNQEFYISQSAYKIKNKIPNATYNEEGIIEFKLSGYITGHETLVMDLKCLQPGEFLIWNKNTKNLKTERYFSYKPTYNSTISEKDALSEIEKIFDELINKIIKNADKKQIAIPLSGGLDSRILLCKLHEKQYSNIVTFTYGPKWNFEALAAKKIAKRLNVPWKFINIPKKLARSYFNSTERIEFWKYSSNLKTIPCSREYAAIRYIKENQLIHDDAIIINGQSGDYITGGHISKKAMSENNYNLEDLYDVIINKHYDLWKQHKTEKNLQLIKIKIKNIIYNICQTDFLFNSSKEAAQAEEVWEYEGRQICYVVNGQRIYDYYGYKWEMPLWDKKLVDFYELLPLSMKQDQSLYKKYLQKYNYLGLFPNKEKYIWRWPIPMLWVIPTAQIIGWVRGKKAKNTFYAKMRYYGHYANQYHFFEWQEHKETHTNSRSIISLYVPEWLNKLKLSF